MEPATDYVLRWEKLETTGDLPTSDGLHGHSMVVPQHQEGTVLVFGGSCNGWTYSDNYSISIDGTKTTWKRITPTGTELPVIADHQTILYKNKYLITYGGRGHAQRRNHVDSGVPQPVYNSIHVYNMETGELKIIPGVKGWPKRKAFGLVEYDSKLWIWGGWDHRTLYNDMYCIDLAELEEGNLTVVPVEQGGDVPSARHGHCAAVYDEKMIIFGGTSGYSIDYGHIYHSDIRYFDFKTKEWGKWETTGDNFLGVETPAMLIHGDKLYTLGGHDDAGFDEDFHILDLKTKVWSTVEQLGDVIAPPRCCMTIATWKTTQKTSDTLQILMLGGYGPRYWGEMEDKTEYDTIEDRMTGRVFHKPRIDPHLRYKDMYIATISRR